jgi:xanthine dehydrogenase accessory factor
VSELVGVIEALIKEVEADRPAALCTVIRTRGSTPQCAGATMLLRSDFKTVGTLGGGCVEAEVHRRAFELLSTNQSALLDFVLDHDYGWDDGLICGGKMTIGVVPVTHDGQLAPFRDALSLAMRRQTASFPIRVEHEGRQELFRVNLEVPPNLLIVGAGHVGHALASMAVDLDFHVTVIDDRADYASAARFGEKVKLIVADIAMTLRSIPIDPACYVVIVTRGHKHDEQALEAVISRPAGYIGLIGSKRKARLIFDDLRARGIDEELLSRVHTPVGLDIGAITVSEIAVSIAAQLVQVRRKTSPILVEGPL